MPISSRTPEGIPSKCPMCGKAVNIDPSVPPGDAPCPHCGQLLWFPAGAPSELPTGLLNEQRQGDVLVVTFNCARIPDESVIEKLREELWKLNDEPKKIVLDFSKVEYLSSAALGVLITFDKRVKAASGRAYLCNLRADIREIFQITRLDRLFTIHKDRESALRAFDPPPNVDPMPDTKLN